MVFADDWGRHPSSCQHLIGKLLPRREVVWVNTIGTRPPRLDLSTVKRAAGKFRQWFGFGGKPVANPDTTPSLAPTIVAPKMWPSFHSRTSRQLNAKLLTRSLKPIVAAMSQPPIVITTLPLVADLVGVLPVHRWVYYCVDDFGVWPGYDGVTMSRMEADLVPKMDEVVCVSQTLQEHLKTWNRSAHLLTHGVDLDHWREADSQTELPEFAGLEPPYFVFWGVIDRRLDFAFLQHLSQHKQRGTIVVIGPQEDPDPALLSLPGLVVRPPVAFAKLPAIAQAASVLIMPYDDRPVTRAMQPLKMKEYLATGRPAVVRSLPSTIPWADALDVVTTPEEFTQRVIQRSESGVPESQKIARLRLSNEGWTAKALQFERWCDGTV